MRLNSTPHLLIPFAACSADGWLPALAEMPPGSLTNLSRLLQGMRLTETDRQAADTLSPPHERAQARALGLASHETPDGLIPWAASDAVQFLHTGRDQAWAWITPCHWAMGHLHATLSDPAALQLRTDESRALLAMMQPYFETDGMTLHYIDALGPGRWLAEGDVFRNLPTASLDRVLARDVDAWLPGSRQSNRSPGPTAATGGAAPQGIAGDVTLAGVKILTRLQNEMQMLLYTHPSNDERQARHQLPVNSFWISGTGALPAQLGEALFQQERKQNSALRSLAEAVFKDDWTGYAQAWAMLETGDIATLLGRQQRGETVRLTLCGDYSAQTFETHRPGIWKKVSSLLTPLRPLDILKQL